MLVMTRHEVGEALLAALPPGTQVLEWVDLDRPAGAAAEGWLELWWVTRWANQRLAAPPELLHYCDTEESARDVAGLRPGEYRLVTAAGADVCPGWTAGVGGGD